MKNDIYTKKLCMSEFRIQLSTIPKNLFFDVCKNERLAIAFIYIERGTAILRTDTLTLHLTEGSLLHVPEKISYSIQWLSEKEIKYYTISSIANGYNTDMMKEQAPLQVIPELSNEETGEIFQRLYTLMQTGERIQKIQAISLYYGFYATVVQYLKHTPNKAEMHRALLKAIEIISTRYAENLPLSDIAKECCISETRLSHLFKEQINTSPIAFRNEKRIQKAVELLKTEMPFEEICAQTGFNSIPYFYETFKKLTKLTPSAYRKIVQSSAAF